MNYPFARVLVLEDDPKRTWFLDFKDRLLGIEKNPHDFVRRALHELPDTLFLDHDLECVEYMPYPREVTGTDVVKALVENWKGETRPLCIVHSMNAPAAKRMAGILEDGGFTVHQIPYALLHARIDIPSGE